MGASLCEMWRLVDTHHLTKEAHRRTTLKKRQKSSWSISEKLVGLRGVARASIHRGEALRNGQSGG